jgi:hypothetical protein
MGNYIYTIKRISTGRLLVNSLGLIFYTTSFTVANLQRSQLSEPDEWCVEKNIDA